MEKSKIKKYGKGRRLEYKVISELRKKGYLAWRSAGSHSPFDVIGINPHCIMLVQVKSSYSKKDLEKLKKIRTPLFCYKQLWVYNKGKFLKF